MRKLLFSFRYAYRNIIRHPLRSISLFLTILILSFVILTTFTLKDALIEGIKYNKEIKYDGIDIIITYDSNSRNKIINSDKMVSLYQYYDYYAAFFEYTTTISTLDKSESVLLISGTAEELTNIVDEDLAHLQYNEVIITKKLAENIGVVIGDEIDVYIAGNPVKYKIVNICKDKSIFRENAIFIQKNFYLKQFSKEILGVDLSKMTNITICNKIYIGLKNENQKDNLINILESTNYYPNSKVFDHQDYSSLASNIEIISSTFYAIIMIVCIAILFVIFSIITLRVYNFKNEIGIVETIGGSKRYLFYVLLVEIIVYAFISMLLSNLICKLIYEAEFAIFSGRATFNYNFTWYELIGTLLGVIIISLIIMYIIYLKYCRLDTVDLAKNKKYDKNLSNRYLIIIAICLSIIWLSNQFVLNNWIKKEYISLISVTCLIVLLVIIIPLILRLLLKVFHFDKVFTYIISNNLINNYLKHNSLKVLLISMVGIIIISCVNFKIKNITETIEEKWSIDYVIGNVNTKDQTMIDDLYSYQLVDEVVPAIYNSNINTADKKCLFFVLLSCDIEQGQRLFDFKINNIDSTKFMDSKHRYIIVDEAFTLTNNYHIGDTITLLYGNEEVNYEILSVVDLRYQQFAYTNELIQQDGKMNSLIISSHDTTDSNKKIFFEETARKYGSKMQILIDVKEEMKETLNEINMGTDVFCLILAMIMGCFIITIINNTILCFKEIEPELTILEVLGSDCKYLNKMIIKEMLISFGVIIIPLILLVVNIYNNFANITLLFGFYGALNTPWFVFVESGVLGICCFMISYCYYFIGVKKIKICQNLKK